MVTLPVREQLLNEFDRLSPEKQRQVLEFTRTLDSTLPPGISGEVLLAHMGTFHFEPGDLDEIAQIIEDEFEQIDLNEWQ